MTTWLCVCDSAFTVLHIAVSRPVPMQWPSSCWTITNCVWDTERSSLLDFALDASFQCWITYIYMYDNWWWWIYSGYFKVLVIFEVIKCLWKDDCHMWSLNAHTFTVSLQFCTIRTTLSYAYTDIHYRCGWNCNNNLCFSTKSLTMKCHILQLDINYSFHDAEKSSILIC